MPKRTNGRKKGLLSSLLASDVYVPTILTPVRSVLENPVDSGASYSSCAKHDLIKSVPFAPRLKCEETSGEEYENAVDHSTVHLSLSTRNHAHNTAPQQHQKNKMTVDKTVEMSLILEKENVVHVAINSLESSIDVEEAPQ